MPLYEYRCRQCRSHLEVLQKVWDEPLKVCPRCGGELEKLIRPAAIQFKGTGWYITDYARCNHGDGQTGHGNGQEKEKKEAEKGEAKPTSHSPDKPDSSK